MRARIVFTLILLLTLAGTSGCVLGFGSIRGSGNVVTQEEDFTNFDGVQAERGCRVTLSQGSNYRVVIRIDDNLRDFLKVERKGSTLRIGLESGQNYRDMHFEADIQMPDLRSLQLSGGSRGMIDGFTVEHDLKIGLSGGSRVDGVVDAEDLEIGTSGGAQAELSGSAASLELDGSGGSQMRLEALESGPVHVSLSGGSRATVHLGGPLTGSLSGGSSVYYSGDSSEIKVSKSGGARVVRR